MSLIIEIPDDVQAGLKYPAPEVRQALTQELAFALYARWGLSLGLARKMARMTKREFMDGLASRGIERHYAEEDLAKDWGYAQSRKQ
ncbi:MAG: UPF0175 family protein [Candidatus Sumerlaeota bacterium]|nr:UPF0175 family protein [Candidatus Sumerlaeota bacterium]